MGNDKKWEDMGECVGVVRSHKFYESPVSSIVSEIFVTSVMFTIQNESITGLKIRIRKGAFCVRGLKREVRSSFLYSGNLHNFQILIVCSHRRLLIREIHMGGTAALC